MHSSPGLRGRLLSDSSILPIDKISYLLQLFLGARSEWNGLFFGKHLIATERAVEPSRAIPCGTLQLASVEAWLLRLHEISPDKRTPRDLTLFQNKYKK